MPKRPNIQITAESLALWSNISRLLINVAEHEDPPEYGTPYLLARAVLALIEERNAREPACPARPHATGPCIESIHYAGRCVFCEQPMQNRAAAPPRAATARGPLSTELGELRALIDSDGARISEIQRTLNSDGERLGRIETALGMGARPAPTSLGVRLGRLETRASSLEKHAIEVEMLVRPSSGPDAPCSLPGVAQRIGTVECALLLGGTLQAVADTIKEQTPSAAGELARRAGAEPAPPAAEPHQAEPAGPADPHATCIGLDNGCPECTKARDAERERNPFHCTKRTDGGECTPDDSFHCVHCGRTIVGPTEDDHGALRSAQIPESY
jgi:hypothetical protein